MRRLLRQESRRAARHAPRTAVAKVAGRAWPMREHRGGQEAGVCPEAHIAGMLIKTSRFPDPIQRRRMTFSDTSRIRPRDRISAHNRHRDRASRSS